MHRYSYLALYLLVLPGVFATFKYVYQILNVYMARKPRATDTAYVIEGLPS